MRPRRCALSDDAADIGRVRPAKLVRLLVDCLQAVWRRFRHGADVLYYVPAPAKRAALYRDWVVMALWPSVFSAIDPALARGRSGIWLDRDARPWEEAVSHWLLGRQT